MIVLFVLDTLDIISPSDALRRLASWGLVGAHESLATLRSPRAQWRLVIEPHTDDGSSVDDEPQRGKHMMTFYHTIASAMHQHQHTSTHLLVMLSSASHGTNAARRRLTNHVRARFTQLSRQLDPATCGAACEPLLVLQQVTWPTAVHVHFDAWWRPWLHALHGLESAALESRTSSVNAQPETLEEAAQSVLPCVEAKARWEPACADEGWDTAQQVLCDPCDVLRDTYAHSAEQFAAEDRIRTNPGLIVLDLCCLVADEPGEPGDAAEKEMRPGQGDVSGTVGAILAALTTRKSEETTVVALVPDLASPQSTHCARSAALIRAIVASLQADGIAHIVALLSAPRRTACGEEKRSVFDDPLNAGADESGSAFTALSRMPCYFPLVASAVVHGLAFAAHETQDDRPTEKSRDTHRLSWLLGNWTWLVDARSHIAHSDSHMARFSPLFRVQVWSHLTENLHWSAPSPAHGETVVRVSPSMLEHWCDPNRHCVRHHRKGRTDDTADDAAARVIAGPVELRFHHFERPKPIETQSQEPQHPMQTPFLLLGACLRHTSMHALEAGQRWLTAPDTEACEPHFQTCTTAEGLFLPLLRVTLTHTTTSTPVATILICSGHVVDYTCVLCHTSEAHPSVKTPTSVCTHVASLLQISTTCVLSCASSTVDSSTKMAMRKRHESLLSESDRRDCEHPPEQRGSVPHVPPTRIGLPAFMLRGPRSQRALQVPKVSKRGRTSSLKAVDDRPAFPCPGRDNDASATKKSKKPRTEVDYKEGGGVQEVVEPKAPPAMNENWRVNSDGAWECEWDDPSVPCYGLDTDEQARRSISPALPPSERRQSSH